MDYSPPGSSVHGIFQATVLEWVAISFSRGSSQSRDWTWVSRIAGRHFTVWATRDDFWVKTKEIDANLMTNLLLKQVKSVPRQNGGEMKIKSQVWKGRLEWSVGLGCQERRFSGGPGGGGSVQAQGRGPRPVGWVQPRLFLQMKPMVLAAQQCFHTRQTWVLVSGTVGDPQLEGFTFWPFIDKVANLFLAHAQTP